MLKKCNETKYSLLYCKICQIIFNKENSYNCINRLSNFIIKNIYNIKISQKYISIYINFNKKGNIF